MTFRNKVLKRVWDATDSTDGEFDDHIPRVDDVKKMSANRSKIVPMKLFKDNKLVTPEDYDDVIQTVDLVYITGTMKLVFSPENKTLTMMCTPNEVIMANAGPKRGGGAVAEAPVDFSVSTADVDVASVLAANEPPAKRQKK